MQGKLVAIGSHSQQEMIRHEVLYRSCTGKHFVQELTRDLIHGENLYGTLEPLDNQEVLQWAAIMGNSLIVLPTAGGSIVDTLLIEDRPDAAKQTSPQATPDSLSGVTPSV